MSAAQNNKREAVEPQDNQAKKVKPSQTASTQFLPKIGGAGNDKIRGNKGESIVGGDKAARFTNWVQGLTQKGGNDKFYALTYFKRIIIKKLFKTISFH